MKKDLTNVTFIVPLFIDTDDRLRNIVLTVAFLLYHFDTNIIIKEVADESSFIEYGKPILDRLIKDQTGLVHIFEQSTRSDESFHRTKVLNDMIMMSKTDIVVNYDSDILLPVESYVKAVELLETCDVVYPYRFGEEGERKVKLETDFQYQIALDNFQIHPEISEFIKAGYDLSKFDSKYFYYPHSQGRGWAEYGMVQFFKRQVYIDGYLENERFIAYAPEDLERFHRWEMLGYDIQRIDECAYHLEHKRTPNSWFNNPFMKHNNDLWDYLKDLSKEDLIKYYEEQDYVKERLK